MKKLLLICLALVLAMGGLGVGYAMWSDTVTITGPVTTGEVEACLTDFASNERGTGPDQGNADPQWGIGNNAEGKDVAWLTYQIVDCDEAVVTVHGAYPYYQAFAHFTICNTGTVPIRAQDILVTNNAPNAMVVEAWDGVQIEPGQCNDFTFRVNILQTADQGATYTFTIQILYVQWNEWTPTPP